MFKKNSRLGKNKEFENVFKKGRAVYGKFVLIRLFRNNLDKNRFGVLIGNKVSKLAVTRNKLKRRIRGSIYAKFLFLDKGFDIVVVAFPDIIKTDFHDLDTELDFLFRKLRILK